MTQLMMIEESGLARSLDPVGGSAFLEKRTDDLASAAWTRFQTIEAQGGLPVFTEAGSLAAWAKAANAKREAALRAEKARAAAARQRAEATATKAEIDARRAQVAREMGPP